MSQGSKGAIAKRTRAQVGTTNRKRPDDECPPEPPAPVSPSPPRVSSSPSAHTDGRQSTVMNATASSMSKQHDHAKEKSRGGKRKGDGKGAPLSNLETMQCKFVESFEAGKNNLRLGDTYKHDSHDTPPTRFSPAPPPRDTSHLIVGERGSPAFISEKQRLDTTYHTTIHTDINENEIRKAQAREREEGRLARIRDNNARVEANNDAFQTKLTTDSNRRVATVKRQQENYAQAVAIRQARGGE
eukprot:Phypoly_transcript_15962.p1 GENE.Phypoly_transcript_15962~~Phypoly_transcript_15962.p1  ORF type:complete len:243 (+),score=30.52 Phypoly_transcript_15962:134-862(+)